MIDSAPNPGSREALQQGCTCAAQENNYGLRAPHINDGWPMWQVALNCPLHGHATATDNDIEPTT